MRSVSLNLWKSVFLWDSGCELMILGVLGRERTFVRRSVDVEWKIGGEFCEEAF